MSDNPKLRHQDGRTIASGQRYEQAYATKKLQEEFPHLPVAPVRNALEHAERAAQPSEGREGIMNRARRLLV